MRPAQSIRNPKAKNPESRDHVRHTDERESSPEKIPSQSLAEKFVSSYFSMMDWRFPHMHKPTFFARFSTVLEMDSNAPSNDQFFVYMVSRLIRYRLTCYLGISDRCTLV